MVAASFISFTSAGRFCVCIGSLAEGTRDDSPPLKLIYVAAGHSSGRGLLCLSWPNARGSNRSYMNHAIPSCLYCGRRGETDVGGLTLSCITTGGVPKWELHGT